MRICILEPTAGKRRLFARRIRLGLLHDQSGVRTNDGYYLAGHGGGLFCALLCLYPRLRQALREAAMYFDYALSGLVTVLLTVYLIYALIRPERF